MEGFVFDLFFELLNDFFHAIVLFGGVKGGLGLFGKGKGVGFF
jgi:hypothetical protein